VHARDLISNISASNQVILVSSRSIDIHFVLLSWPVYSPTDQRDRSLQPFLDKWYMSVFWKNESITQNDKILLCEPIKTKYYSQRRDCCSGIAVSVTGMSL